MIFSNMSSYISAMSLSIFDGFKLISQIFDLIIIETKYLTVSENDQDDLLNPGRGRLC